MKLDGYAETLLNMSSSSRCHVGAQFVDGFTQIISFGINYAKCS